MRLLVDCHVFDGKFQGTRTYIQGLYTPLIEHRDIDFYFVSNNNELLRDIFGNYENVHYIQFRYRNALFRLLYELPKIIKDYKIDYAHYQYISPFKKCCKEIVTIHDLLFLDYPQFFSFFFRLNKGLLFRMSALKSDILLTVSDYSKDRIAYHFSIDKTKIYVTPNAVLSERMVGERPDVKKKYALNKYILAVSRIEPRKNHYTLLKAFVDLKLYEKGYKLMMVGVPDAKYKIFTNYYNHLTPEIRKCVIFRQVPFKDLVELYKNASLFVFPSYAEGFGIPPLEALEYGCPLLCSNATAMNEFNFPDSIMFNPNDIDSLKNKMLRELNKPTDLTLIKKKSREYYCWNVIAEDFYQLLMSKANR